MLPKQTNDRQSHIQFERTATMTKKHTWGCMTVNNPVLKYTVSVHIQWDSHSSVIKVVKESNMNWYFCCWSANGSLTQCHQFRTLYGAGQTLFISAPSHCHDYDTLRNLSTFFHGCDLQRGLTCTHGHTLNLLSSNEKGRKGGIWGRINLTLTRPYVTI